MTHNLTASQLNEPLSSVSNPHTGMDISVVVTALADTEPPSPPFKIKVWCTTRFDHDKEAMRQAEVVTKDPGVAAFERMKEALKEKLPTCLRATCGRRERTGCALQRSAS